LWIIGKIVFVRHVGLSFMKIKAEYVLLNIQGAFIDAERQTSHLPQLDVIVFLSNILVIVYGENHVKMAGIIPNQGIGYVVWSLKGIFMYNSNLVRSKKAGICDA